MATVTSPPKEQLITADLFYRLMGDDRCELIKGGIVPMPPPPGYEHCRIELRIGAIILGHVEANKLGSVASGEVGILVERDPDTVRAADIAFVSNEREAKRSSRQGPLDVAPDLVVEVLSPSNTVTRTAQKLGEYFAAGVRLVWLVDPQTRRVIAYRSLTDVRQFGPDDNLPGDDVLPGFAVPVARFFE